MSTEYIDAYSALIANQHETFLDLFKFAAKFDIILANCLKIKDNSDHAKVAKTILSNYQQFKAPLEEMLFDYSENFYKGLKKDKREKRVEIFYAAFRACLSGGFYNKNELIISSLRDITKVETAELPAVLFQIQEMQRLRIGVEYRYSEELQARDYFSMEFCVLVGTNEEMEKFLREKLAAKSVQVEGVDYAQLLWQNLPICESAVCTFCNKNFVEQMREIGDKYDDGASEGQNFTYLGKTAFQWLALSLRGWKITYGEDNQLQMLHDGIVIQEYY